MQSGDVLAFELQEARSLINKIEKERAEVEESLRKEIKKRDSIIKDNQLNSAFRSTASQYRMNPKYIETMLKANRSEFNLSPDGEKVGTADGATLADWFEAKREEYPEMFLAPTSASGTGAVSTGNGTVKSRLVSRNDSQAFLENLEAIAVGNVVTGD